jgi:hypothetical protein
MEIKERENLWPTTKKIKSCTDAKSNNLFIYHHPLFFKKLKKILSSWCRIVLSGIFVSSSFLKSARQDENTCSFMKYGFSI